jgi:hypothetical protein
MAGSTATEGPLATVAGVTADVAADAGPVPIALVAATVKVYGVPLVSPVTVAAGTTGLTVVVAPPGDATTV